MDLVIQKKGVEIGRGLFQKLFNEHHQDSECVGAAGQREFKIFGKQYTVTIQAFWEKIHHFDYQISGHEINKKGLEFI